MMRLQALLLLGVSVMLLASGCGEGDSASSAASSGGGGSSGSQASAAGKLSQAFRSEKLELRNADGEEINSFRPDDENSVKFYDADDHELCRLKFDGAKLVAYSPDDARLFELKPKDDKVMIKDETGDVELFKFKLDGKELDFYAPGDRRLYRFRPRDYGYRLEDNSDNTLFRARLKDEKVVLRNTNDETVLYTKDTGQTLPLAFFGINEMSIEQQAACFVFFFEFESQ